MAQDPYKYFRPEAREIVDQFSRNILDLEKGDSGDVAVQRLLRLAHTLKGAARVVKQAEIANRAHAIEDMLAPLRDSGARIGRDAIDAVLGHVDAITCRLAALKPQVEPAAAAVGKPAVDEVPRTIRADLAETDAVLDGIVETHALMNGLRSAAHNVQQVGQLADLLMSQFSVYEAKEHDRRMASQSNRRLAIAEEMRRKIGGVERSLGTVVDQMDRELRQVREAAERLRLVPAQGLFTTLERLARDTARVMGKQIAFSCAGGDIRLDAHVLDTIQRALVQFMRNAVAHGIESPEDRAKAGKPAGGKVSVSVSRRDRRIVFSCSDDGRGVDLDAVRRVAAQRGLAGPMGQGSDEIMRLLLRGGISTSKTVTEEPGRGIGLDVVRDSVERLAGEVTCRSAPGQGTMFEIVIPPSLASMDALNVVAANNGRTTAIPLDAVRSTRRLAASEITFAAPGASILYDDKAIPFIPLAAALDGAPWSVGRTWAAVIVAGAGGLAAIGVDRLLGTGKIVVRPLPDRMAASLIVVAASLDSEGNPQVLLDPDGLVEAARRGGINKRAGDAKKRPVLVVDDSLTTRMLEQSILESAGYDVDTAVSGEEALEGIRQKNYALVLVDVEMPGMDGFTFIERIRADAKTRDIPAILVTSLAEPEHRKRGRDVGAQGYIVKNEFDQAELLKMIQPMMAA
ncbi:MAG: hybrid sensor histidine kinase/response regulator [Pseudolabrys sp.]